MACNIHIPMLLFCLMGTFMAEGRQLMDITDGEIADAAIANVQIADGDAISTASTTPTCPTPAGELPNTLISVVPPIATATQRQVQAQGVQQCGWLVQWQTQAPND